MNAKLSLYSKFTRKIDLFLILITTTLFFRSTPAPAEKDGTVIALNRKIRKNRALFKSNRGSGVAPDSL